MLKYLIILLLIVALAAGGYYTYTNYFADSPEEEPVQIEEAVQRPEVVSAEAFVVPMREADLSFERAGRVVTLNVQEGEQIGRDDLIAELDNITEQARLTQAEAAIVEAQANLEKIQAGPTAEQVAQAQARLSRAQAALAELVSGPTAETIAIAEAQVETARANLAQTQAGFRDEDIEAAAARLLQAEAELREKQADYDAYVVGVPTVAEPYGVALEKARLDYELSRAEYDKLLTGPTAEEIAIAQAQLKEAQSSLDRARSGQTPEQIAQAQAEVEEAQAALHRLQAGATDTEIGIYEARLETTKTNRDAAQVALDKTRLLAPFEGLVGLIHIEEGEMVQPGQTILLLGDTSQWRIETDDLTEIDVVNIQPGAAVAINVDALPDETYKGEVVRITPKAEEKAGDQTYTVLIDITEGDTGKLRWGMTTFVDIEIGSGL